MQPADFFLNETIMHVASYDDLHKTVSASGIYKIEMMAPLFEKALKELNELNAQVNDRALYYANQELRNQTLMFSDLRDLIENNNRIVEQLEPSLKFWFKMKSRLNELTKEPPLSERDIHHFKVWCPGLMQDLEAEQEKSAKILQIFRIQDQEQGPVLKNLAELSAKVIRSIDYFKTACILGEKPLNPFAYYLGIAVLFADTQSVIKSKTLPRLCQIFYDKEPFLFVTPVMSELEPVQPQ